MKNMNRNNIQETLRVTCRHIIAMLLAVVLLTGIASAENVRKMVSVSWGGEQEVIEEQVQEEKEKALRKLDYSGSMVPGQFTVIRNAEGKYLAGTDMSDIIAGLQELKEMLAVSGRSVPGKLFDQWNAANVCVNYNCVPTGEYHLDSSENENGYITEKYSIDPSDRVVNSYWIILEKADRKTNFSSWLSGNWEFSTLYEPDEVPQAEEVSIPGMEKAMYIRKLDGSSRIVMCRPLETEIYILASPNFDSMAGEKMSYGYEFLEFENMTPEEVTEFFAE